MEEKGGVCYTKRMKMLIFVLPYISLIRNSQVQEEVLYDYRE